MTKPASNASATLYAFNMAINSSSVGNNPSSRSDASPLSIFFKSPLRALACNAHAYDRTFGLMFLLFIVRTHSNAPSTFPFAARTRANAV